MKVTGIILSVLGVGLLVTGIVILIKQNKAEKKSSFVSVNGKDTPILSPDADCISKAILSGNTAEEAAIWCRSSKRAIKSSTNPYNPKEPKSNACGCGA